MKSKTIKSRLCQLSSLRNEHAVRPICLALVIAAAAVGSAADLPRMSKVLLHNTVRVESQKADGLHVGTGFFYSLRRTGTSSIPVIVTCWHVVQGATTGKIVLSLSSDEPFKRKAAYQTLVITNFEACWVKHPDGTTDVAVLPLAPFMRTLKDAGMNVDVVPLDERNLPTETELSQASIFVRVKMIGYPIGIWDSRNNLPVVRTGMTATDLSVDYDGNPEFLVDVAIFPGSSGSPVFVAEEGAAAFGPTFMKVPDQLRLLGIAYKEYEFPASGGVEIVPIPTAFDLKARTAIPANLAFVIKANKLLAFESVFK